MISRPSSPPAGNMTRTGFIACRVFARALLPIGVLAVACMPGRHVVGDEMPPPPSRQVPISSFGVDFVAAGRTAYPVTRLTTVERYQTVSHMPGQPDWDSGARKPERPFVTVGRLTFPYAWHLLEEGVKACGAEAGLVAHHVGRVGGHAVLRCEVFERARGVIKRSDTGVFGTVSYRALELDVIRYTDADVR